MLVAIRSVDGKRVPRMMKWGLIPHWAKDDKLQFSTFNARAENFATKPSFRDAWKWHPWEAKCLPFSGKAPQYLSEFADSPTESKLRGLE
jgi:putative SOS response-associated peptidase YedK